MRDFMDRLDKKEKEFLEHYDISRYDRPSLAADIVVFAINKEKLTKEYRKLPSKKLRLLLIKRALQPFQGAWALPGGFMKRDETIYETARRELKEETGTDKAYLELCHVFSDIGRDPRGWIISQTFMAILNEEDIAHGHIEAGSDAKEAKWFNITVEKTSEEKQESNNILTYDTDYELRLDNSVGIIGNNTDNNTNNALKAIVREHKIYKDYHEIVTYQIIHSEGIAFDHAQIILCAFNHLKNKLNNDIRTVFDFMPTQFTLTDLQETVELILGKELIKPNFRRKIADYVIETEQFIQNGAHRPAKAFVRNLEKFYD